MGVKLVLIFQKQHDHLADASTLESTVAYPRLRELLQQLLPTALAPILTRSGANQASHASDVLPPRGPLATALMVPSTARFTMDQSLILSVIPLTARDEEARPTSMLQIMSMSSWSVFDATNLWGHTRMSLRLSWMANR